jgi:hypothetical protein
MLAIKIENSDWINIYTINIHNKLDKLQTDLIRSLKTFDK